MKTVTIIGGGISGLITAIQLARAGIETTLIEKKVYPFHRVCGEYISNETVPFLKTLGLYPSAFSPPVLSRFQLTSVNGRSAHLPLALGGFGISRYAFDQFLYESGRQAGVHFMLDTPVDKVEWIDNHFVIQAKGHGLSADVVVGAFGKRSTIDATLNRSFMQRRSPYVGVKYHIRTDHPMDLIALHNFKDGYCGISNVEGGRTNLCYLTHRQNLKQYGSIQAMEKEVLFRNPYLKSIFENSEFLFDKPETINEISFETKGPVGHHILMTGDAGGMITPLCGNGMALAIHSSKMLSGYLIRFCRDASYDRITMENDYARAWRQMFEMRLWTGRQIQRLFGSEGASNIAVNLARHMTPVASWLVSKTHGAPF